MATEFEERVKATHMVRTMFGSIRASFKSQIYELYDANENLSSAEDKTYKESCARWHLLLKVYSKGNEAVRKYINWIQIAYEDKEDLDEDDLWLLEMRRILPDQFMDKIDNTGFTQVPRGAIMDETPLKRGSRKEKQFAIFRKD